jgi:hypothetical protein
MGKYEVTVGQYAAFLNAVAATDTYALYRGEMATAANTAGIAQNGSFNAHTYSVIGSANHPVTWVSWWDAARFAEVHEDLPDWPRLAGRKSAATGGCQECEGQGWFRTRAPAECDQPDVAAEEASG